MRASFADPLALLSRNALASLRCTNTNPLHQQQSMSLLWLCQEAA